MFKDVLKLFDSLIIGVMKLLGLLADRAGKGTIEVVFILLAVSIVQVIAWLTVLVVLYFIYNLVGIH